MNANILKFGNLHPQYITSETGKKLSVVLSVGEFYELLEDVEDLVVAAERRDEPTITHEELLKKLKL